MPQRVQGMLFLYWSMTRPEATFFQAVVRLEQARTHLGILERPEGMAAAPPIFGVRKRLIKVGFNPIESLYNARFDPSKRILYCCGGRRRGSHPPDACEGAIFKFIYQ
ncbi:Uncharacterised protein [Serratia ficaria]|uniref:hypothetical protein n=1 Tax=Serratia ficaria TaxID=61651 RepID=UPI0021827965|nr:hypothetical protein [Serratia ficaria]CAI2504272.1 Uncharacterised protein [Serratia ficaria]